MIVKVIDLSKEEPPLSLPSVFSLTRATLSVGNAPVPRARPSFEVTCLNLVDRSRA
jgi:hypothetical protein